MRRLRAGDAVAFKQVHDTYHAMLLRFAQSFLKDRSRAEDAVQECWGALVQSLVKFEGRSSLKQWLYAIVANKARSIVRRESRNVHVPGFDDDPDNEHQFTARGTWSSPPTPWHDMTPERLVDGRQMATHALSFIDTLPNNQRAVIILRDVEGFSAREVCDLLEISDANQRILLHRGRTRVREKLNALLG